MERVSMHPKVYEAAKSGDFHSLMKINSENGGDLFHQTTPKGNNILHVAAQCQRLHFIKDLQHPSSSSLLWQGNYKGETPFHVAAKVGSYEAVRLFTDLAKSPDQPDAYKELLRRPNSQKDTALHYAIRGGHYAVVKLLIEEDPQLCDITNAANESPLYVAAHRRFSDIIELILSAFMLSSSHKGPNGLTALHAAVHYSLPSCRKILEKRPEVIREGDDIGWTPLHYAAWFGNSALVRLFLQHDNSVGYVVDKEGQSVLHVAAIQGHVRVIDELLRFCPDACDMMNTREQTALHAAVISGRANVVKHILGMPNLKDLINEQDTDGNSALHLAAFHKQYNIIYKLARDKRVDRLATNKDHFTAIQIFYAHKEMGYRAAKVNHVLENSHGMPDFQGLVIEYFKKRADEQHAEGQRAVSISKESNTANRENDDSLKGSFIEIQQLVAALIATVTFAATFTMPGGYNDDGPNRGMTTLAGRAAFKAFVIFNTTAFCLSVAVMFLQYDISSLSDRQRVRYASIPKYLVYVAIVVMWLAFACGTFVVLTRTIGIGIIPFVIGGCLAIVYVIGAYLDPESPFPNLRGISGRHVRSLLFDYGFL